MAFNPFTSFRKYQKFWMASLVLMAMFTFVLCSGLGQGGLEDIAMRWMGRKAGAVLAKVNGREMHSEELHALKMQRQVANEFMRKFCDYLAKKADEMMKRQEDKGNDPKALQARQQAMARLLQIRMEFNDRLKKPRYFEGSFNLEGLADFKMWLAEADRLRIDLDANIVRGLVESELLNRDGQLFNDMESRQVMFDTRRNYQFANDQYILQAVRDEYRVRIARLAMLECQPDLFSPDRFHMMMDQPREMKYKEGRLSMAPYQLWEFYKQKRAEFDVTLIPIEVSRFFNQVRDPQENELLALFRDHRKDRYDPTSEKPGFEIPQQIKVSWATADPRSEAFKHGAKVLATLETLSPGIGNPFLGPIENAFAYAAVAAAERESMNMHYQLKTSRFMSDYWSVPLTSGNYVNSIMDFEARENPRAIAAVVAQLAVPMGELTAFEVARQVMVKQNGPEYDRLARIEAKKRVPVFATIVGQAAQGPLPLITEWFFASEVPQTLPLDVVQATFRETHEANLARRIVTTTMIALRKGLETTRIQGNEKGIERVLEDLKKQYTFEVHSTKDYFNRYTLDQVKELKPLRDSYDKYYVQLNLLEGRGGTERNLKEADFSRLFFDKSEPFSVSVGKSYVKAWPPATDVNNMPITADPRNFKGASDDIKNLVAQQLKSRFLNPNQALPVIDLYKDAEKPILLWKSDEKASTFPEKIDEVRPRVLEAYRTQRARKEFAVPLAQKVAEELAKPLTDVSLLTKTRQAADELKVAPIVLEKIAPLQQTSGDEQLARRYTPYQLPRDTILYPRPDMVKHILSFGDPQKAIQFDNVENKDLDAINKTLYDAYRSGLDKNKRPTRPFVQILTNEPRTHFFVAVAIHEANPNIRDFELAYRLADGQFRDEFLRLAYEELSKQEMQTVVNGLRTQYNWWVTEVPDERKGFDNDAGG